MIFVGFFNEIPFLPTITVASYEALRKFPIHLDREFREERAQGKNNSFVFFSSSSGN